METTDDLLGSQRFQMGLSLWLHVALYALIFHLWTASPPRGTAPRAIEIEFYRPAALPSPAPSPLGAAALPPETSARPLREAALIERTGDRPTPPADGSPAVASPAGAELFEVSRMLSADALSLPASREARAALATLTDADRREQLCAVEAMEQVARHHRDHRPTRLVPHALVSSRVDGTVVHAAGAAFRSARQWYQLAYRCGLSPDGRQVVSFAFRIGQKIERGKWDQLGLAAVY